MNARIALSSAAVLLFFVSPASSFAARNQDFRPATAEELALKEHSLAPGAPAIILHWVQFQDDKNSYRSEYFRIKIMTEEGKKYADVEIPYLKGFSSVGDIKARTISPDGSITDFRGRIYDKPIVKTRRLKYHAKVFTMPEVTAGSIIEYRHVYRWDVSSLFGTSWTLQQELPVLKANLALTPYKSPEYSSYFIHRGLPPGKVPEKKRDTYELELENLPAFVEESFAPPASLLKPRVEFLYTRHTELEPEKFWQREGKEWADVIERFIGKRGLKQEAHTLTAGLTTDEEKLRSLYARVQGIRNLSFEEDKTEQEQKREKLRDNKNAEDVLRNGYGYRNELNRLFVGLARAAGFEANVVRLATRDEGILRTNLPDGRQLNGEIGVVTVDGREVFVDAGTPYAPFGILSWEYSSTGGLRIAKKAEVSWVEIPFAPATENVTRRVAKLRLEDEIVKGTVAISWTGQDALSRRITFLEKDDASRRRLLEDELKALLPEGATVKLTNVSGLDDRDHPLVVEAELESPTLASAIGSRTLVPLEIFTTRAKNPFSGQNRQHPIAFEHSFRVEDSIELTLPEGLTIETLPKNANVDVKAMVYESAWQSRENRVTLERSVQLNALLFETKHYQTIREFYSRQMQNDQEQVVLRKGS